MWCYMTSIRPRRHRIFAILVAFGLAAIAAPATAALAESDGLADAGVADGAPTFEGASTPAFGPAGCYAVGNTFPVGAAVCTFSCNLGDELVVYGDVFFGIVDVEGQCGGMKAECVANNRACMMAVYPTLIGVGVCRITYVLTAPWGAAVGACFAVPRGIGIPPLPTLSCPDLDGSPLFDRVENACSNVEIEFEGQAAVSPDLLA